MKLKLSLVSILVLMHFSVYANNSAFESFNLDAIEPFSCASWRELLEHKDQQQIPGIIVARVISRGVDTEYTHYCDAAHLHKKLFNQWPYASRSQLFRFRDNPINKAPIVADVYYSMIYADEPTVSIPLGSSRDWHADSNAGRLLKIAFDALYASDMHVASKARLTMARLHRYGKHGYAIDEHRALSLYQSGARNAPDVAVKVACLSGSADLCYVSGQHKDWAQAAAQYQEIAALIERSKSSHALMQEYQGALTRLGDMYHSGGNGLKMHHAHAAQAYEKLLAVADNQATIARISFELGKLYQKGGHGLIASSKKATNYYQKAHDLSDVRRNDGAHIYARSALVLGELYRAGDGDLKKEYAVAVRWFEKARDQKHDVGVRSQACLALGDLCCQGGCGITQNYKAAAHAYGMIEHDTNDRVRIIAQSELAQLYRDGRGVERDMKRAVGLFKNVAQQELNEKARNEARVALQEIKEQAVSMVAQVDGAL